MQNVKWCSKAMQCQLITVDEAEESGTRAVEEESKHEGRTLMQGSFEEILIQFIKIFWTEESSLESEVSELLEW